jgi:hypothetical protein
MLSVAVAMDGCSEKIEDQRKIGMEYFKNGRCEDAMVVWLNIFFRTRNSEDLIYLIATSLNTRYERLVFCDMDIERYISDQELGKVVTKIKSREGQWNGIKMMEDMFKDSLNTTLDVNDGFPYLYSKMIRRISEGLVYEGLEIGMRLFEVETIVSLVDYLVDRERLEVLYFLQIQSSFFVPYYNKVIAKIQNALRRGFSYSLKRRMYFDKIVELL